jgi:hypothetical protein
VASLSLDASARTLAAAASDGLYLFDARAPGAPLARLSPPAHEASAAFSCAALDAR